jgi:hypothetical protein
MPKRMRAIWQEIRPGCIQEGEDGPYMPTAVVMITEAGLGVVAAFEEEIPLS